jgi:phosphoribosylformylglycinamidine (FGAM) synthase-like amidotransferase family enzyme
MALVPSPQWLDTGNNAWQLGGGVIMNSKTSEELASLMDIVLPGGVRLGDATRQQVMEAVEHYRKQQEKYTAKARQCCEALYLRFPVRQR